MRKLIAILIAILATTACTNSESVPKDNTAVDTILPSVDTSNKAKTYAPETNLSNDENAFLLNSALSAKRIIALAHLATQRSKNTNLRNQATKLAHQYNTMLMHLESLAQNKGDLLNTAETVDELKVLKKEQDVNFDKLYAKVILAEHAKLIQQLENGTKVPNQAIKNFATNGLVIVNGNNRDIAKLLE